MSEDVTKPARARASEGMGGLAKGLGIIEAFESSKGRLTIAEAARLAGLTRPAARRCLLTLADLGYVDFDGKYYRPLPRVLRLSASFLSSNPLSLGSQPVLASARDALGESVSLAILEGNCAMFIARAEADRLVSTGVRVGARLPLYCSSTGRVLLGKFNDADIAERLNSAPIEKLTDKTVTDVGQILDIVVDARANGYAISDEEIEIGMSSIAVPIFDRSGSISASLSVSVAPARVTVAEMVRDFLPVLQRHAAKLNQYLE